MKRTLVGLMVVLGLTLLPTRADAFCGFYVAGTESTLRNGASTVVLMREGTRTVLSMQNDYQGPTEDFALVVPVPVVLQARDVRTLDRASFERVERLTGPRLVEYWEQDPCSTGTIGLGALGTIGHGMGTGYGLGGAGGQRSFVHVEAQFAVAEYDIVVLGTNDSSALETWLRDNHYRIPEGASAALRPYVESGMKFFVARVNAARVHFEDGHAVLSPLRMHYESEQLALPVRLGLLNSAGAQDLVIHVLARNQRFEVANYPNVFIPTNLDVTNEARAHFGDFYSALLDRTLAAHPGAVVTEYAWQSSTCDPCPPDATLDEQALTTLGGDVLYRGGVQPAVGWGSLGNGARVGAIRMDDLTTEGSLSVEVVRRVERRHTNEVRFCMEQDLAGGRAATGIADVRFTIGASGAVTSSNVVSQQAGQLSPALLSCVSSALRRWMFPMPEDGQEVRVQHTLRFEGTPAGPAGNDAALPTATADEFVVTRLHYRYGTGGLREGLIFRAAEPVEGGRESFNGGDPLSQEATPSRINNFQARYAIRHAWQGEISCEHPMRRIWGGPPTGQAAVTVAPTHGAHAPVQLDALLVSTLPSAPLAAPPIAAPPIAAPPAPVAASPAPAAPAASTGICTAQAGTSSSPLALALSACALFLARRRRASR